MMRQIYSLFIYLLTPFLLLRLWWKGRSVPAYRQRISERFALNKRGHGPVDIWVHAVSLGEVIAVSPLIDALVAQQWKILITTMTVTGSEQVQKRFAKQVQHQYIPYDLPWALKRFFKKTRPRLGLIVETEIWPNLIYFAAKVPIPLFLLNARLSESSYQGYKRVAFFFKPLLNQLTKIFAQSEADARRFIALGAEENRVFAVGNIKFDLQTEVINQENLAALKAAWGELRPVVIFASTHENEEQLILEHLRSLQAGLPKVLVLLAPRHPERFQEIYHLSKQLGFNTGLRSQISSLTPSTEVVILDCLGELLGFYQLADYAFVGGSLVPVGGHNVLEPIAMQVPVFSGKAIYNFKTICQVLQEAEAIELVDNAEQLIAKIIQLSHQDKKSRDLRVSRAEAVLEDNKGVLSFYLSEIQRLLKC